MARQIGALDEAGAAGSEALDSLYCLGLLALRGKRPGDAAARFERLQRLTRGRLESLWSARLEEGLRLARAGLATSRT